MRTVALRLILLVALSALLIAALGVAVWVDNASLRGVAERSPITAPFPYSDGPALGVNVFNLHLEPDPVAVDRTFALARDLGARYARMQVPWDDIEIHSRGDFTDRRNAATIGVVSSWDKYDRIVAAAVAHNIELIMRVDRPPPWACAAACSTPEFQAGLAIDGNSMAPPDDLTDYARFLAILVERYRGQVRYFQIWNEPNLKNEWGWQTPKPADFLALLRLAYEAVKTANPDAVVLFPGLAPTDGLDPRAPMTELEYLDEIYRLGGAAYFDIMAAQNYGLGQPPSEHRYVFLRGRDNWRWDRPIDTRNDVSRVVLLREVMERHGDLATPVWVTEFGYNAAPDRIPSEHRFVWGPPVDELTKGAYLVAQIERARREWPWMGVMNVWMLRYGGYAEPHPDDPTPYFALVSRDWQPLPSYDILQDYVKSPAVAHVGVHRWDHPAVTTTPTGWQVRFAGTGIELRGGTPTAALLDGVPVALDGNALRGLPDAVHTLELRGGTPPTEFSVVRSLPWRPLADYGPLVLIVALAVTAALTMRTALHVLDHLLMRWQTLPAHWREWIIFLAQGLTLAVAYRASAQLPLTMLGLLPFIGLAIAYPALAVRWVAITVPLYFLPKGLFDARFGIRESGIYLPLHEVVLLIAALATVVRDRSHLLHLNPTILRSRATLIALTPALLVLIAGVWGVLIAEARGPALRELRWMIVEPLLFAALLWWHERQGRPTLMPTLIGWIAAGAVSALVAIAQAGGINLVPLFGSKIGYSEDLIATEGVIRATGFYGHPNNLGLAMGRVWPLAAALAWAVWQRQQRWLAMVLASCAILSLAALGVSFSRGAYLGAIVAGGVLLFFATPPRYRCLSLIAGGIVIVLAAGASLIIGIERLSLMTGSSTIRLATWRAALAMLVDHPLGIGLDQFLVVYPRYTDPALTNTNEIYTAHPHNLILDLLLRGGPLLLIGLGWATWCMIRTAARYPTLPLAVGITATMAGALAHGLVDAFYFWPDLAMSFWLLVMSSRIGLSSSALAQSSPAQT
ncbi:O-antigen ligase family protein [Chloroflexus aggregans]|uniref:O-antigen polymerase n=1 Tax=Chloroflexus aggregans (strain MD-66 / DSM 9485) TaxID=326427 RepID=B8G860_CHLAD|nr:O-antigen ligase family protein [Chloroflexus aggregans]ACL26114.1 O-antigen polymerase [Chloroflexus aggregans DSM 9485]